MAPAPGPQVFLYQRKRDIGLRENWIRTDRQGGDRSGIGVGGIGIGGRARIGQEIRRFLGRQNAPAAHQEQHGQALARH